ncbi:YraN family protein [Candidatus Peregrinibacteria bacterium]|nr:YraN family protein [Candidatus Peregrinibacteria bacterium]
MDKQETGKKGESIAKDFLIKKGYNILDKNYLKRQGEIDIIAFDPEFKEIVFVEVKTRKNSNFGYPEEFVTESKIEKIETTANIWLEENNKIDDFWRIDIIAIELSGKNPKIEHLKNITQGFEE